MVNLRRRRQTSYKSDAPRPIYILKKKLKCKSDGMPFGSHFHLEIVNRMTSHPVYILKNTEGPFSHFYINNFDI